MDLDALYQQVMAGPGEEEKKRAMAQALAAAGFGILGSRTGKGWQGALNAAGQGGLLGMNVYNNEMANASQAPMQKLAAASQLMDFQGKKQAYDDSNAARDVLRGFQMPGAQLPSMAPTQANAAALAQQKPAGNYEKLNAMADALEARGLVQQAQTYRSLAEKYAPKYKGTETVMKDGKPVLLQTYENQAPSEMTGYGPKPDYKQVDTGGKVGFYDPLTGMQGGQFDKTMTPGETDASKRGWSGLGLEREKFGWQQSQDKTTGAVKTGDTVAGIRKEFNGLPAVQSYNAVVPLLASARTAPDTPAGDLDIIYGVGKALDPNSVVREGEMGLVIAAGSPLQKYAGMVNYIQGGGRLSPEQRQMFIGMLDNRLGQLKQAHDYAATPYINQVKALGLPADQIFQPERPKEQPKNAPVQSQQQYDALPSGAVYTAPDGTQRRKK